MPEVHPSKVHALPSSHWIGRVHGEQPSTLLNTQTPATHESVVQAFRSLQFPAFGHGTQPGLGTKEQVLFPPHESVVHALPSLHAAFDEQQLGLRAFCSSAVDR